MLSIFHVSSQSKEMTAAEHSQGLPEPDGSGSFQKDFRAGITLQDFTFPRKTPKTVHRLSPCFREDRTFHHPGLGGGPSPEIGGPRPLPTHSGLRPLGCRGPQEWEAQVSRDPWDTHSRSGQPRAGPGPPLHPETGPTDSLWVQQRGGWSWSLPLLSSCRARWGSQGFMGGAPHNCPAGGTGHSFGGSSCRGCWETRMGKQWPWARNPTNTTRTPGPVSQALQALTLAARGRRPPPNPHDSGCAYISLCVTLEISYKNPDLQANLEKLGHRRVWAHTLARGT